MPVVGPLATFLLRRLVVVTQLSMCRRITVGAVVAVAATWSCQGRSRCHCRWSESGLHSAAVHHALLWHAASRIVLAEAITNGECRCPLFSPWSSHCSGVVQWLSAVAAHSTTVPKKALGVAHSSWLLRVY